MQNLKLVLTIREKNKLWQVCQFLILEAWSLHVLLCPIYTSLDCRALFCHLADREKKTIQKMRTYFHTQNTQVQLLNQVLLHICHNL